MQDMLFLFLFQQRLGKRRAHFSVHIPQKREILISQIIHIFERILVNCPTAFQNDLSKRQILITYFLVSLSKAPLVFSIMVELNFLSQSVGHFSISVSSLQLQLTLLARTTFTSQFGVPQMSRYFILALCLSTAESPLCPEMPATPSLFSRSWSFLSLRTQFRSAVQFLSPLCKSDFHFFSAASSSCFKTLY